MIELSATAALTLYLGLTLGLLLGIWLYHHLTSREKKISLVDRELLVCEYCQCAYLEKSGQNVSKCPQCHSFNKSNLYKPS